MDKITCSSCVLYSAGPLLRVLCSLQLQPETAAGQSSQTSYTFSYSVTAPRICSETPVNISTWDFIREQVFPCVGSAGGDCWCENQCRRDTSDGAGNGSIFSVQLVFLYVLLRL